MRTACEFKVNGIGGRDEYGRRVCGNCGRAEELSPDEVAALRTAWRPCSRCGGSGMQQAMDGVDDCHYCGGDCMERARDDKGRFTTLPLFPIAAPFPPVGSPTKDGTE